MRVRVLVAVGCWFFSTAFLQGTPLTGKELLSLEGDEFHEKAKVVDRDAWKDLAAGDLAAIAQKWAKKAKGNVGDFNELHPFEAMFSVACRKAGSAELDKLIDAYLELAGESDAQIYLFPYISDACIERELSAIKSEHLRFTPPKLKEELPADVHNVPPELQEAWISYREVRADFKARAARDQVREINYEENEAAFGELLGSVLKNGEKNSSEQLLRYFSSNDCIVVGAGGFADERAHALLLAFLKERKLSGAAGAAIDVRLGVSQIGFGETEAPDPTVDTLTALGLDWEKIVAGGLLDLQLHQSGAYEHGFLNEFAAFGSDRAASLMILLAAQADEEDRSEYASAMRVFIADPKPHHTGVEADEEVPESTVAIVSDARSCVSAVKISEKLQKQLIGILIGWSKPDVSNELGEDLVSAFESTGDRAVVQGLAQLAAHPSHEVSSRAVARLNGLGEKAPQIAKSEPVRFQILVNGKKLPPGSNIECDLDEYDAHSSESAIQEVSEDGSVSIDRDRFVDPHQKATRVSFGSWNSEPAFHVEVPVPPDLSKLTTVTVELVPLRVDLDSAGVRDRKRFGKVQVTVAPKSGGPIGPRYEKAAPPGEEITLLVQKGEYTMTAQATGAATWESTVQVSKESPSISIPLRTGSDVHLVVFKPKGKEAHGEMLLHNGQEVRNWRDEKGTYRGLSPGNYVIHIPSSKERREIFPGESDEAGQDEIDYAGRDLAVTVGEKNSPPVIDLGEIYLEALSR